MRIQDCIPFFLSLTSLVYAVSCTKEDTAGPSAFVHFTSIDAGVSHALAMKTDGTLMAWGRNDFGQLGDGTLVDKNVPVQIGPH